MESLRPTKCYWSPWSAQLLLSNESTLCPNPINPYRDWYCAFTHGFGTGDVLFVIGADLPPSFPIGPWAPAWFFQDCRWCHLDLGAHPPLYFAFLCPKNSPCRTSYRPWLRRRGTAWWLARWWCLAAWKYSLSAVKLSLAAAWQYSWAPLPESRSLARVIVWQGNWHRHWGVLPGRYTAFHRPLGLSRADRSPAHKNITIRTSVKTYRLRSPLRKVKGKVKS